MPLKTFFFCGSFNFFLTLNFNICNALSRYDYDTQRMKKMNAHAVQSNREMRMAMFSASNILFIMTKMLSCIDISWIYESHKIKCIVLSFVQCLRECVVFLFHHCASFVSIVPFFPHHVERRLFFRYFSAVMSDWNEFVFRAISFCLCV